MCLFSIETIPSFAAIDWLLENTGTNMRNSAARSNTSRQHSNLLECASLKHEIQGALTAVFAGADEDIGIGDPIPLPTHRNAFKVFKVQTLNGRVTP